MLAESAALSAVYLCTKDLSFSSPALAIISFERQTKINIHKFFMGFIDTEAVVITVSARK